MADAVAATREIFDHNGQLVWLNEGKLDPVNGSTLREFISKHIVTLRLVNNGTAEEPNWVREFSPLVPPNVALKYLLGENPKEGSLLARVPPATLGRGCS